MYTFITVKEIEREVESGRTGCFCASSLGERWPRRKPPARRNPATRGHRLASHGSGATWEMRVPAQVKRSQLPPVNRGTIPPSPCRLPRHQLTWPPGAPRRTGQSSCVSSPGLVEGGLRSPTHRSQPWGETDLRARGPRGVPGWLLEKAGMNVNGCTKARTSRGLRPQRTRATRRQPSRGSIPRLPTALMEQDSHTGRRGGMPCVPSGALGGVQSRVPADRPCEGQLPGPGLGSPSAGEDRAGWCLKGLSVSSHILPASGSDGRERGRTAQGLSQVQGLASRGRRTRWDPCHVPLEAPRVLRELFCSTPSSSVQLPLPKLHS